MIKIIEQVLERLKFWKKIKEYDPECKVIKILETNCAGLTISKISEIIGIEEDAVIKILNNLTFKRIVKRSGNIITPREDGGAIIEGLHTLV
ncbi:MAG: hypothetical protein KAU07_03630 [Candidatus Andersenbacteria bacterium]|nr:hypothetical protein [Candidatus Andersenbacteria bacterium]